MRLLADENFPKPLVEALRAEGHDVLWARTHCAGWKDVVLLEHAESEARILLTLDKDFWQIAVQRRVPLEQSGVCGVEQSVGRTRQHRHRRRDSDAGCSKKLTAHSLFVSPDLCTAGGMLPNLN